METWYVLEDGNVANPAECTVDEKGKLFHKGVAVATRGDAYSSRSVDVSKVRQVAPDKPKRTYKTRDLTVD